MIGIVKLISGMPILSSIEEICSPIFLIVSIGCMIRSWISCNGAKIALKNPSIMSSKENESKNFSALSNPKAPKTQDTILFNRSKGAPMIELISPVMAPRIAPMNPPSSHPLNAPLRVSYIPMMTVSGNASFSKIFIAPLKTLTKDPPILDAVPKKVLTASTIPPIQSNPFLMKAEPSAIKSHPFLSDAKNSKTGDKNPPITPTIFDLPSISANAVLAPTNNSATIPLMLENAPITASKAPAMAVVILFGGIIWNNVLSILT